jgi:hypothetical protein
MYNQQSGSSSSNQGNQDQNQGGENKQWWFIEYI